MGLLANAVASLVQVERHSVHGLQDVQRLYMLLDPMVERTADGRVSHADNPSRLLIGGKRKPPEPNTRR